MDYRKDYYQILEVSEKASKEEIRAAYRRLAKLYHPDKNAGNAAVEEKFKLINEANEILGNEILRHEYDAYRAEQESWKKNRAEQEPGNDGIKQSNKKSYTKTKTVVTETRIYIRGEITVKYWADCLVQMAASHNTVLDYKINPTEASVTVSGENIFPVQGIPMDYLRAFRESDIFIMPLPQPIRCAITREAGTEYYELMLNDIRIKNIRLAGITKHENKSYGTLTGQFYGYCPKFTSKEVEETVTECFGETGKAERKEEGGINFIRKEYYHPDCSTYWGDWIPLPKAATYERGRRTTQPVAHITDTGCAPFVWGVAFLAILFLAPKFFLFCLLLTALGLLLYYGGVIFTSAGRILSVVCALLFLTFLITALRSVSGTENNYIKKNEKTSTAKTTRTVRPSTDAVDTAKASPDTLITHFLKWEDYSGKSYEGNISISVAALHKATTMHGQMNRSFYQDMGEVYKTMLDYDSSRLLYLYETFDSIKAANDLDEIAFSQMLVSAIQSQPYYLVLDKGCDENYNDDFTRNYLANCKTDCCIGNELFGVRTPVEFLSDLKGDCDTRSLLIYQLLKHYNYNAALLTSNYYKHALIALNFTEPVTRPGLSMVIDDKKYYLWETTSPGLNYGEVPSNFSNLDFWNISLLNKKTAYEINPQHL